MCSHEVFLKEIDYCIKRLQEIQASEETASMKYVRAGIQLSRVLRLVEKHLPQQEQEAINRVLDLYANV